MLGSISVPKLFVPVVFRSVFLGYIPGNFPTL